MSDPDHEVPIAVETTYYGLPQLKPAPFKPYAVGIYVFLAGLSGAAALLAALFSGLRRRGGEAVIRRADALSLLAPTVGTGCLIYDLYTPRRFYNMLRIFRPTSAMSIGSWLLVGFGASATAAGTAEQISRWGRFGWARRAADCLRLPAALSGAGLATYTAALFAGTSTPRWAAAPRALGVQFGASSVACAASALALAERGSGRRRSLDGIAGMALAVELAALLSARRRYRALGIDGAAGLQPRDCLGIVLPLGLIAASLVSPPGGQRRLSRAAAIAVLGGSLAMRIHTIKAGMESAKDPALSLRLARPVATLPRRHIAGLAQRPSASR